MPKTVLTESKRPRANETAIARIRAPESGAAEWFDAGHPGLCLRVHPGGGRSFCHFYRVDGKLRRRTLGSYPALSLDGARAKWIADRELLREGKDPEYERQKAVDAAAEERAAAKTFEQAVEEYHRHYLVGESAVASADSVKRQLLREGRAWHGRLVSSITGKEIGALLRAVRDGDDETPGRPYLANRVHANLTTFFTWCARADVGHVPASPMVGVPKPYGGEEARERSFTPDELGALWRAANRLGIYEGAYLRCLLLTGKRKNALARLRRAEIGAAAWWTPPQPRRLDKRETKTNWPIPLPYAALHEIFRRPYPLGDRLVKGLPQVGDSPFVFEGRHRGKPLSPGRALQDKIKAASGVEDFYFHAIRHSVITLMGTLRLPADLVDRYTDHAPKRGVAARDYDHSEAREELHDLADTWGRYVTLLGRERVWAKVRAHLDGADLPEDEGRRAALGERKREFCALLQTGGPAWARYVRSIARPARVAGNVVPLPQSRSS